MSTMTTAEPRRSLDQVADRIRELIVAGELKEGDKLPPERDLAKQMGVGRPVLRESLRTLENAGMLILKKGKYGGAFVAQGSPRVMAGYLSDLVHLGSITLAELTEARIWIEEIIVRIACERATEKDFGALEENIREAEALFAEGRLADKTQKNIAFHNILAASTRNAMLVVNMHSLTDIFSRFAEQAGSETTRTTFQSRWRFMRALRARDTEAAVEEMNRNLKKTHRLYTRLAQKNGLTNAARAKSKNPFGLIRSRSG